MPMTLLQRLAAIDLSIPLADAQRIQKLRVLVAAGHVYATIPFPYFGLDGRLCQDAATVHSITPLGFKVLRYFGTAEAASGIDKDRGD